MPRRVIPIRSGPAQFQFQDYGGGLEDGLAQAIATLAELPTKNRQIQQDYELRTAQSDRENRSLDRQQSRQDAQDRRDMLGDAVRTGAAPDQYLNDPQFQGAVKEFQRKVQTDGLEHALRQRSQDLELARAGGYAGPDRGLGEIAANVGEDQQARRDAREQQQAASLAHGVAVNDRRWSHGTLADMMGMPQANRSMTGPVPSPINPDLVHVGRGGIRIDLPKAEKPPGLKNVGTYDAPDWRVWDPASKSFVKAPIAGAGVADAIAPPDASHAPDAGGGFLDSIMNALVPSVNPDPAAYGIAPAKAAPAASAPVPVAKPPVSLSQARSHPNFAGMSDDQIRAMAAQNGRQVIP